MTHDQRIASDPAISAWVSASAGTGKTKVLTDRVLRLLLSGAEPSRILCITYTRAASAEMQSRIAAKLASWVRVSGKELEESIAALTGGPVRPHELVRARRLFALVLDAPERIRIQTIHGFCQSVLARFPLEAEVPPHFTAIDDITSRELLKEARALLFLDAAKPGRQALAQAVSELAARIGQPGLQTLLAQVIEERRKFSQYFDSSPDTEFNIAAAQSEEALAEKHLRYTAEEEQALRRAYEALCGSDGKSDTQTRDALCAWLECRDDPQAYARAYITLEGKPRKTLCTKECATIWEPLISVLLAEQQRMLSWHDDLRSLRIDQWSTHVAVLFRAMLELYQRLKAQRGYLDYDDLILHTMRLLHRPGIAPWVLYKLDGGLDHLLVDEAQDTSPEQWRIVLALAEEFFAGEGARSPKRTLFVVGDEKQSIFSFQGADPFIFDAMRQKLSRLAGNAGMDFKRVRLALSFRSSMPVLQAVDSIFAAADANEGLIFAEADIRHEASRIGTAGRVELWPLAQADEGEVLPAWYVPDTPSHAPRADLLCAKQVADTIDGWLKEKRMLSSKGRPVNPGDILILVQRRGVFANALLRMLKRRKIAVAGADRLLLTEHIAVMDCMALARFLLLPQDDLSLAEILRSPFANLSEEELFELAHARGEKTLWQQLKATPAHTDVSDWLSDLLARTDYMPPYELFAHILEAEGGRRKLAARLGTEIADPLNEFLGLALQYGRTHPPSLQGFVHWLETGEIEIKRDMEKGQNGVRILTVHGAKGLQAPIVFLPDTTRMPLHVGGIFWEGREPVIPLWSPAKEEDDKRCSALREAKRMGAEREYRRLLYVALTRAEDELYICGWKGGKAIEESCWYELVHRAAQGWQAEGERRVLESGQSAPLKASPTVTEEPVPQGLPAWVSQPAAAEPLPSRPLAPSRLRLASDLLPPMEKADYERGMLVHRLLQYLPEVAAQQRPHIMERFFARYGAALSEEERRHIGTEVTAILEHPEFAPVFGPGSVAEASICGMTGKDNPITIAGRIDRLAVLKNDVYIIDYKTGRKIPAQASDVPEKYLRQMEAYRRLVKEIYQDKTVHCALLWTAGPILMSLPDILLERLAA